MKAILPAIAALAIALPLAAQTTAPPPLKLEDITYTATTRTNFYEATFSQDVLPPDRANVTVSGDSGLSIASVDAPATRHRVLVLVLNRAVTPGALVTVCFTSISYVVSNRTLTATNLCKPVTTIDATEIKRRRDALLTELKNTTKTSSEKNIFASGFVTTAKSGTQGGTQLALNPDLGIKGMTSFLNINKTTQTGADPKNFEAGSRYRYVRSMSADLMNQAKETPAGQALNSIIERAQKRHVAALIVDFAGKLEGEATNFNVANFVGESSLSFRSVAKQLGGSRGYYRWFITPVGFEGGRNLNSQGQPLQTTGASPGNTPHDVRYIARYKGGLGFNVFYEDWNTAIPFKRLDLDVNGVARQLFEKEALFDTKKNSVNTISSGFRQYVDIAVKLFVGQGSVGRYGVKLNYTRGSLPPVFARVKSFQFGFLFESSEDSSK